MKIGLIDSIIYRDQSLDVENSETGERSLCFRPSVFSHFRCTVISDPLYVK